MSNEDKKTQEEDLKKETDTEETCEEAKEETKARAEGKPKEKTEKKEKAGKKEKSDKEAEADKEDTEEDEALNTKYLRLMADFQNYKRRAEKEKGDTFAYANEKLVAQLLDVVDSFERALQHECTDEGYAEGMDMIFKQLTGVLEKAGLEEIKALGEDFDPNYHNAVMMEDNDQFDSGKVTEVMQKGYTLNSKVIRPSMVKVNN